MPILRKHPDLSACLILTLLVLGCTLPFLNHAYHIDEPLFLRIAEQIKENIWDPYGFTYLWHLQVEPMHKIAAFPPLFSYYLALVSWKYTFPPEWLIHLSLVPWALISVLSFYSLARQFNFTSLQSFFAAAWLSVTPAFVLSANMAMPDVAVAAFTLTALVLSIQGWKKGALILLILGGLLLGAATLLRYNAIPIILISFLLGLTFSNWKKSFIPSGIASLILFIWLGASYFKEGSSHTSETLTTFVRWNEIYRHFWAFNIHLCLSTFIPLLLFSVIRKRTLFLLLFASFFALDFALLAGKSGQVFYFQLWPDVLFFGLGILVLIILVGDFLTNARGLKFWRLEKEKSEDQLKWIISLSKISEEKKRKFRWVILFLWILSVLSIQLIYVAFASKYLLMLLPPLFLLLLKIRDEYATRYIPLFFVFPIILTISVLLTMTDFRFAEIYRQKAPQFAKIPREPNATLWFTGHWGFQFYLEKYGALPLPYPLNEKDHLPQEDDLVVTAESVSPQPLDPTLRTNRLFFDYQEENILIPFRTMLQSARTGFYSDTWGPLPYSFSLANPVETFRSYLLVGE